MTVAWVVRAAAIALGTALFCVPTVSGQVVTDSSFGRAGGAVPKVDNNYDVGADLGKIVGDNLFHSFNQFDIPKGDVATFSGPSNIQNAVARVTGGTASSIDGTIRSTIDGANLYLLNPHGIIFGPEAQLDVRGSFAASTADYLAFDDGTRFVAALDADDSMLSTAPVSAFGFLDGNSAVITARGSSLGVPDGKSISIVGGDVTLEGNGAVDLSRATLHAAGGSVTAVSVKSAGEVPADVADVAALGADAFKEAFPEQGDIVIQNGAAIDVSGEGGGRVVIRGGKLTVDAATIQANTNGALDGQGIDIAVVDQLNVFSGGKINAETPIGPGRGGDIDIAARSIRLDGRSVGPDVGVTQISAATGDPNDVIFGGGSGTGGDIRIKTGTLELVDNAQISSASYGLGAAGNIDIDASSVAIDAKVVTLTGIFAPTFFQAFPGDPEEAGRAGNITIKTDTLGILDGGLISGSTQGTGDAGVIDVMAKSIDLRDGTIATATSHEGSGGDIHIETDSLHMTGVGASVQAATTFASPLADAGRGGNVQITARTVDIANDASIFTDTFGSGVGGTIDVRATQVNLQGNATISARSNVSPESNEPATGPAGSVDVHASDSVTLTGNSGLRVSAVASDAGDVNVTAGNTIQLTDSDVSAQAAQNGGNITLVAPSLVYALRSPVTANAGTGQGGNVTFDPKFIILNDSPVTAKVDVQGNGGVITINSDFFFASNSPFDVSTPSGIPGTVAVTAPDVDLTGALVTLPGTLLGAESQLNEWCGVRLPGDVSSFVTLGKGGAPVQPDGPLPSLGPVRSSADAM